VSKVIDLTKVGINKCNLCPGFCNKKNVVGSGSVLYVVPYDSDLDEILEHRGVVIREIACENGIDYMCNIYVRSLMHSFDYIVANPSFVSKLVGRKVEDFEKVRFQGKTIVAAINPCDIRVKQELGVK